MYIFWGIVASLFILKAIGTVHEDLQKILCELKATNDWHAHNDKKDIIS